MGDNFYLVTETGVGSAEVELLGDCESPVVVTGHKGTPPKEPNEVRLATVTAKIGVGVHTDFIDPIYNHQIDWWEKTAQLTISDAGTAWYVLEGKHDRLSVVEEPEGSDTYVLSKDGQFMGRVTLSAVTQAEGPE